MLGSRAAWLLALVVACGREADDGMTSFGERTFVSEMVKGYTLIVGTQVTIGFDARGRMSASAGCDVIGSDSYELHDGVLVASELFVTELGCDAASHEQDQWLKSFLQASPSYGLAEPRLYLVRGSVALWMTDREVADAERLLSGRAWVVDGLIEGDAVVFGPASQDATLVFGDDGRVTITTPCATGSARYELDRDAVSLRYVGIASGACPDDDAAVRVDQHMRELLVDGDLAYEIDADDLTLSRDDLGLSLTAQ